MPALADIAGILCDCPLSCKLLTVQACLPTVRFWPLTASRHLVKTSISFELLR